MTEYNERTYFEENEEESVKGFTIVNVVENTSEEYQIAEKWNADATEESAEGDKWVQYTISEAALITRVEDGKCEPVAELTDEQYEKVCSLIDQSQVVATPAEA